MKEILVIQEDDSADSFLDYTSLWDNLDDSLLLKLGEDICTGIEFALWASLWRQLYQPEGTKDEKVHV